MELKEIKAVRKEGNSFVIDISATFAMELFMHARVLLKGDVEYPVRLEIKRNGKQSHVIIPSPLVKKYNIKLGEEWELELNKKKNIEVVRL